MKYSVRLDTIQRTIAQVVTTYRDQLTNFVYETLNGSMDAADMSRAHRALVQQLGPQSYLEGMREGGVPPEEADAEDKRTMSAWVKEQTAHLRAFANDAEAARGDDAKRAAILGRLALWIAAMEAIGNLGLMSARANAMGTWKLGATERHCRTCAGLHGKRHRLSWYKSRGLIPREPGSTTLECRGYKCKCAIYDSGGNRLI